MNERLYVVIEDRKNGIRREIACGSLEDCQDEKIAFDRKHSEFIHFITTQEWWETKGKFEH
jgi:hypothetical protein